MRGEHNTTVNLNQTLFLEVLVGLAVVDVPFLVFKLFHRLLFEDVVAIGLLQLLRHWEIRALALCLSFISITDLQASASSMRVISWKCFVFGKPRARMPNACLDSCVQNS